MDLKTALNIKVNLLLLFVTLWVNFALAASLNNGNVAGKHSEGIPLSNAKSSKKAEHTNSGKGTHSATVSPLGSRHVLKSTIQPPSPFEFSQRNKRNAMDRSNTNTNGIASIHHLFPTNVEDVSLQKWLALLMAKPREPNWLDEYEEDEYEDEPPAIDLLYGRKPGSMKTSPIDDNKLGGWADEPTSAPIVLFQHRLNKKSNSIGGLPPELILRETAAATSRAQPDPLIMRKLLARMIFRAPRSDSDVRMWR